MEKQKVYAEIPTFNQCTQYVAQLPPVETENTIYYGVEVRELDPSDADDPPAEQQEPLPAFPAPEPTVEQRQDQVEAALIELAAIVMGGM